MIASYMHPEDLSIWTVTVKSTFGDFSKIEFKDGYVMTVKSSTLREKE